MIGKAKLLAFNKITQIWTTASNSETSGSASRNLQITLIVVTEWQASKPNTCSQILLNLAINLISISTYQLSQGQTFHFLMTPIQNNELLSLNHSHNHWQESWTYIDESLLWLEEKEMNNPTRMHHPSLITFSCESIFHHGSKISTLKVSS